MIASLHTESWRIAYRGMLSDAYLDGPIETERAQLWQRRLAQRDERQYVVVAESRGQSVGFACAYGANDPQWGTLLDNLHVAPNAKRQGIGAQMMARVAAWCLTKFAAQGIYLWVLESNTLAREFYEHIGGVNAGRDVWQAPDGSALPELRYVWRDVQALAARQA